MKYRHYNMALILLCCCYCTANAQQSSTAEPHHLSVFVGGSHVEDLTEFTIGLDYEYRINYFLGVGSVIEYATENINATSLLFVADLHIWRGFAIQAGPGVEFRNGESAAVGRIGGLYEFEFSDYTLSPQVHVDITDQENTLVFGLAFGVSF